MLAVEVVFLTVFWAWTFCAVLFLRNTYLPRLPVAQPPSSFALPVETVRFQATDGVTLEGWKIPVDPSRPWIIACHGLGANRSDLLEIAKGLYDARFNLLLFDFRSHGASAGRATSFGWLEQRDLEGALAFLGAQPEVPARPYGVYGISMGASVALMVAARDDRLGAIVADSPYTDLEDSLGLHLALMYPALPRWPFLWFVLATYRLRFGVWPQRVSPKAAAAHLGLQPLLVIQGEADRRMPVEGARRILDAVPGDRKALWVIEGAGHLEGLGMDPRRYVGRVSEFFNQRLRGS